VFTEPLPSNGWEITDTEQGDLISLLFFFQSRESRPKRTLGLACSYTII
jgi:hypothetical protein